MQQTLAESIADADETAVVVVCPRGDESCLDAVLLCTEHFCYTRIFVLEYGSASSPFDLNESLAENDLHTINYVSKAAMDPRDALKQMLSARKFWMKYSHVLLIDPSNTMDTEDSNLDATATAAPIAFFSTTMKQILPHEPDNLTSRGSNKRRRVQEVEHPSDEETSLDDSCGHMHQLWKRTTLLIHLRAELRRSDAVARKAKPIANPETHATRNAEDNP